MSCDTVCQRMENRTECDMLVHASLMKGLRSYMLFNDRLESPYTHMSIQDLSQAIQNVKVHIYPNVYTEMIDSNGDMVKEHFPAHISCDIIGSMRRDIEEIVSTMPSAVRESDLAHMAAQREKCGSCEVSLSIPSISKL